MDVDLQKAEGDGGTKDYSTIFPACTRLIGLYASSYNGDGDEGDKITTDRLRERYSSTLNLGNNKDLERTIFANRKTNDFVFSFGSSKGVDFDKLPLRLPSPMEDIKPHYTTPQTIKTEVVPQLKRTPSFTTTLPALTPNPRSTPPATLPTRATLPSASVPTKIPPQKRKADTEEPAQDIEEEEDKKVDKSAFQTAKEKYADDQVKRGARPKVSTATTASTKTLGGRGGRRGFVVPKKKDEREEEEEDDDPAPPAKRVNSSAITNPTKNAPKPVDIDNPNGIESVNGIPLTDDRLRNCEPRMLELIMHEILDKSPAVGWDDIAGLNGAKTAVQEIVVWPILRPDIFTGLRNPPKGLLLFGPPGTGKTMIGKAIASESRSTFFSISASSLTSKWIGDGEKMVRALFAVARCYPPAVIFVDEIDSLLAQRSENENEATRRLKTEFLIQWDGASTGALDRILLVGATNRPAELDEAARRRFVKRLYIPLPDYHARVALINRLMVGESDLTEEEINQLGHVTDGYSGSDLHNACKEAALGPIRSVQDIRKIDLAHVRQVNYQDFEAALRQVRASVGEKELTGYIAWDTEYGSKF